MQIYKISANNNDKRVDRVLKHFFPEMPISAIYKNLRTGKIKLNYKKVDEKTKVNTGDEIQCYLLDKDQANLEAKTLSHFDHEKIKTSKLYQEKLIVLYEDEDILALDKPAGMAVHPGTNHYTGKTMIDLAQAYTYKQNSDFATTLVHRLDLETSGVLLFAKTNQALVSLNHQMKQHQTEKIYLSLCQGLLKKDQGTIKAALARTEGKNKSTKIIISKDLSIAKMAVTHFKVVNRFKDTTLIKLKLETGRMHQIRVHMKSQGHTIIGDSHYGDFQINRLFSKAPYNLKRMFLHAHQLSFTHPVNQKIITVVSPLPAELSTVINILASIERTLFI